MNFFNHYRIHSRIILCLFFFSSIVSGQSYKFRNYGIGNALPSSVVYTLNQDNNGYLWVGTSAGLSRFDGFEFFKVSFPDSSEERYPTISFKDKKGNLWFGCNDGTLFYTSGSELLKVILPESSGTEISSIIEDGDANILVASQRKPVYGIDLAKPSKARIITLRSDPNIFSASLTGTGDLLIGTQGNLLVAKIEGDSLVIKQTIEGFDYSRIMSIHHIKNSNSYIIGTDGNGLFRLKTGAGSWDLSRFSRFPELENLPVKSIFCDSENNLWISTSGEGALKLLFHNNTDSLVSVQKLNKSSGMPGNNLMTIFEDSENNFWLGFNGDGLSILNSVSFEFHTPGGNERSNNIIFTGKIGQSYIVGTPAGFYTYDLAERISKAFTSIPLQAGKKEINSYYIDNEQNIWLGTKGSGLFVKSKNNSLITQFYRSGDSGADYIADIKINGDNIWLATLNGVHIVSRSTKTLKESYNMNNGLSHNNINQILLDADGNGFIATESDRLFRIVPDSGIFYSNASMNGSLLNKIIGLTIDSKGIIWAATQGNGVFECYDDSIKILTTSEGLLSNYTYSILADKEDNIWIGHERGISRYNQKTGLTKVYGNEFARGGACNPNGMYESPDGKIFIGTTEGLIIYDRSKDHNNKKAPSNNINYVTINDSVYNYQSSYNLPYKKRYNIKVAFTGINFSDPEKVYYSTYLENYDSDWSSPSQPREITYNLRDGKYKFNLVSVNEDGLSQESPLTFEINISKPFWRTWWFILSLLVIATGTVIIIIREREKAQKKIQEYLENELDARTKVVVQQKAKLEIQNMEITDSINYAKRIQSSILPDIRRIKEHFRDAFIILYPRDIVSGDFYWFDKIDDDTSILVCADSTGHGVPGAFMSMIGSTLLQDIVSRQRITKPSEILTMLDKQIFSTLNQNLEVGVSNDGMDIVVCEFSFKNRHIRFASAMRPVMLVMGGETYYIKGNRASVGGQAVMEKYFDDQEYYLNEGDTIYLFTDGLPDQFGGNEGKKMKITRLKNLIGEINGLTATEQEEIVKTFYKSWKGNFEQVDDILFMGVKV